MNTEQRRHFSRIHFHGAAQLMVGDVECACEVLDLSLKGALLRLVDGAPAAHTGQPCLLELVLDDGESVLRMSGNIAHQASDRLGLACREIDLDSITHLRRLVELNLGDAALLERELAALLHS